ncbi:uncharacterized protein LOC124290467 [Haliotis rubra]|uniref:uncharacterized protein LOC124290467 n=1 Tax=Haliotis rubra TaxID=36100 RepID=UPI001EE56865|nr:uncharacterized protein LOC124290467 [Haliotis rubra]
MADIAISSSLEINQDLSIYTVNQLKKYLSSRRQNVSGRKQDLIRRIQGSFRLNIPTTSTLAQFDQLDSERCEIDRFTVSSGKKVPPPLALFGWTTDYNNLPDVMEKDIYNYVVLKKNSKRQLKSKGFYNDGHVHKVEVHPIDDSSSHMYISALVLPSFPSADH